MEKELDQAAAAGYRVLMGSRTALGELAVLLERSQGPERARYKLLATTKTSTMQKELQEAANSGFRILPRTFMGTSREIAIILEKSPDPANAAQYLLLATRLTGTLQKEMTQAARNGFDVLTVVSRGEHIVILEKTAESHSRDTAEKGPQPYLLLATEKTSTMQKELEQKARIGYRLLAGSPTSESEIAMFMEKMDQPTGLFEYKLLATNRGATLQNELNVAASGGFRLLWKTVAGKRGTKGGGFGKLLNPSIGLAGPLSLNADETVAVMEKSPQSENHYEYRVVETIRTSTAQADIYKAVQEGFVPVAMVGGPSAANFIPLVPLVANVIVILEKLVSRSSS